MKENYVFIKHFEQKYIDFNEYPTYGATIYENFVAYIDAHIQCDH